MKILGHFQTTVMKALKEIEPNYLSLPGLVICGTHAPQDIPIDDFIEEIRIAREQNGPFLGICFGHQLAAIEYARNVLGNPRATSEEWDYMLMNPEFIVYKLPKLKVGIYPEDGDERPQIMGTHIPKVRYESFWNNFEVRPGFEQIWHKPKSFVTVQYHPEYQSSAKSPHPILVEFLNICKSV